MKLLKLYGHRRVGTLLAYPGGLAHREPTMNPLPLYFSHRFKGPPPLYLIEGEVRLPISTAPGLRGKYGGVF